jgi:hypothetical protein
LRWSKSLWSNSRDPRTEFHFTRSWSFERGAVGFYMW